MNEDINVNKEPAYKVQMKNKKPAYGVPAKDKKLAYEGQSENRKPAYKQQADSSGGYASALKAAFPYTIPVLTGYLFIGFAFGVMFQEKGYHFLWAGFVSLVVYAGSGQYLAVNFFAPDRKSVV